MNSPKSIDMTSGSIMKLVISFALPLCIGNILQQLYTTVDTLVIGNFCSSASLAAIGTSTQPIEIFLCIFMGIGTGVSILISQAFGCNDREKLKKLIATSTSFLYVFSIPLTILGIWGGAYILKIMNVPEETFQPAKAYLQVIFIGTLGNIGCNMNSGILRGLGNSHASLIFLGISCAVNIVLDLLFVAVLGMDVTGAAIATIIAQFTSWFFSIYYLRTRYADLGFTILPQKLDKDSLLSILKVGLPLGFNTSIYSIGHVLQQTVINLQGTDYIAGCSIATKITGIANIAIVAFASAATAFAGQNLGARKVERLQKGSIAIPFWTGLITLLLGGLMTIFSRPILGLFTSDAAVLDYAVLYTRLVLPSVSIFAAFNCMIAFVNGMGIVKYPIIVNMLMLWAVRIPSAWLIHYLGYGTYVVACFPISFTFGLICMIAFYFTKGWKSAVQI